ncbi:MAG: hypothetical protein PHH37_00300 [Paludibacter sp.]|nr:hypothetical protein [Paludibacter sp.]
MKTKTLTSILFLFVAITFTFNTNAQNNSNNTKPSGSVMIVNCTCNHGDVQPGYYIADAITDNILAPISGYDYVGNFFSSGLLLVKKIINMDL